jgi:hypothetical protein
MMLRRKFLYVIAALLITTIAALFGLSRNLPSVRTLISRLLNRRLDETSPTGLLSEEEVKNDSRTVRPGSMWTR